MKTDITHLKRGHFVIMPTFQCNAMCNHCQHACSPQRRETMPLDLFRSCVTQALDLGWTTICLTGGEPFLAQEHIRLASDLCSQRKADLVVQTNGFWGRNPAQAVHMLRTMQGITQLGFSVDKVHLSQIGLDPLLQAMDASGKAGIRQLTVSISYQTQDECDVLEEQLKARFPGLSVAAWPIAPIGRARDHPELRVDCFQYSWDQLQRACGAQLWLSPIVHPNGDLHPCYRSVMVLEEEDPLILGNLGTASLSELLNDVDNKLLMFILAFGGGGLGYLLQTSTYADLLEREYQGVCHFCYEILSQPDVVTYLQELLSDEAFEPRIAQGLCQAYAGWQRDSTAAIQTILICNGSSCGRNHQNYPLIHYLLNRLVESNRLDRVQLKLVDCLNSCATGPNLYLVEQDKLLTGVDLATIDRIVEDLALPVKVA